MENDMTKAQQKVCIQRLKETKDTIICDVDLTLMKGDWLIRMEVLHLLKGTCSVSSKYFEYTEDVQEFIDSHKGAYAQAREGFTDEFAKFRSLIFSRVIGPLYISLEQVQDIVLSVYSFKDHFNGEKFKKFRALQWRTSYDSTELKYLLDVKNLNLLDDFDKVVLKEFFGVWVNALDTAYALKNKTSKKSIYCISAPIRQYLYEEHRYGQYWDGFKGKDYILKGLLLDGLAQEEDAIEILKMVLVLDAVTTKKKASVANQDAVAQ